MTTTACVYHGGCPDGFAAAMAVIDYYGEDEVRLIPAGYGGPPPNPEFGERLLYIVDFSFTPEAMATIRDKWSLITMLDHHATAIEQWEGHLKVDGNLTLILDEDRSGAGLAWDYLSPKGRPTLVNYVEDRDLWRWSLPHSREIGSYILTIPHTVEAWREALELDVDDLIDRGAGADAFNEKLISEVASRARLCLMNGQQIWLANSPYIAGSAASERIAQEKGTPIAGYYLVNAHGEWQYGFRGPGSKELAEAYGGGGHANAAGCRSKTQLHVDINDLQG